MGLIPPALPGDAQELSTALNPPGQASPRGPGVPRDGPAGTSLSLGALPLFKSLPQLHRTAENYEAADLCQRAAGWGKWEGFGVVVTTPAQVTARGKAKISKARL